MINNLQQFHAFIAAICPIVGVAGDGTIFPDPSATPTQIANAQAAASTYTDVAPQIVSLDLALSRMTDAEYQALFTLAQTRPPVHRLLTYVKQLDMALPSTNGVLNSLVAANVFANLARAQAVFAPPPAPPTPSAAPLPPPQPIHDPHVN